jgi:hypothetical protein
MFDNQDTISRVSNTSTTDTTTNAPQLLQPHPQQLDYTTKNIVYSIILHSYSATRRTANNCSTSKKQQQRYRSIIGFHRSCCRRPCIENHTETSEDKNVNLDDATKTTTTATPTINNSKCIHKSSSHNHNKHYSYFSIPPKIHVNIPWCIPSYLQFDFHYCHRNATTTTTSRRVAVVEEGPEQQPDGTGRLTIYQIAYSTQRNEIGRDRVIPTTINTILQHIRTIQFVWLPSLDDVIRYGIS